MRIVSWNVENLVPLLVPGSPASLAWAMTRLGHPFAETIWAERRSPPTGIGKAESWPPAYRRSTLAVVNVYAVNGTSKPYWDHELGTWNGDRHQFKRRFVDALEQAIRPWHAAGTDLVLVGDWNISRTHLDTWPRLRTEEPHATARAQFNNRFIPGLDLVDAFRELHPTERKYTWFSRRSRGDRLDAARVDFALVSRSLFERISHADIDQDPAARARSDHAPLWLDLALPP